MCICPKYSVNPHHNPWFSGHAPGKTGRWKRCFLTCPHPVQAVKLVPHLVPPFPCHWTTINLLLLWLGHSTQTYTFCPIKGTIFNGNTLSELIYFFKFKTALLYLLTLLLPKLTAWFKISAFFKQKITQSHIFLITIAKDYIMCCVFYIWYYYTQNALTWSQLMHF